MKTINIKFNNYLANWIVSSAQKNSITISEFIRDLLYEKMQQGQVEVKHFYRTKQFAYHQNYRNEMGYIIFVAKLLEKFILMQNQGENLRNKAFEATKNILEQLKLNGKEQRFCINLEIILFDWLSSEASRLQMKINQLIKKLIEHIFMQKNLNTEVPLSMIQKIAIEHQITSCKLLEILVNQTVTNGLDLVAEAHLKTKNTLMQLFPEQEMC